MHEGFSGQRAAGDETEEMKQLMSLFFFVESAEVKLTAGEGADGSNINRISELLRQRQDRLEKKEAGNVIAFPELNFM